MESHKGDFLYDWEILIKLAMEEGKFNSLNKNFEVINIEFQGKNIGYCSLVKTAQGDEIIYAKRLNRNIYTRFIKNKRPILTNSMTIILNRNRKKSNEYYLITMFPGDESFKEPEDLNIRTKEELIECLEFWEKHALTYDKSIIQENSVIDYCPYRNMYLAVA